MSIAIVKKENGKIICGCDSMMTWHSYYTVALECNKSIRSDDYVIMHAGRGTDFNLFKEYEKQNKVNSESAESILLFFINFERYLRKIYDGTSKEPSSDFIIVTKKEAYVVLDFLNVVIVEKYAGIGSGYKQAGHVMLRLDKSVKEAIEMACEVDGNCKLPARMWEIANDEIKEI